VETLCFRQGVFLFCKVSLKILTAQNKKILNSVKPMRNAKPLEL
jgi:hypothetical protein